MLSIALTLLALVACAHAAAQFQLFRGVDDQFYWRLLADNHEIILQSEGYTARSGARAGVDAARAAADYEVRDDYFVLKAANGEIVARSETYQSGEVERGIDAVKAVLAKTPKLVDLAPSDAYGAFEVWKSPKNDEYYFHLTAANGEIILQSEGYTARHNALKGIASVVTNAADYTKFEQKEAANGELYFTLKAANGEPIGVSETYRSAGARANGIYSVQHNAANAEIVDLSFPEDAEPPTRRIRIAQSWGGYVVQVEVLEPAVDYAAGGWGGELHWLATAAEARAKAAELAQSLGLDVLDEAQSSNRVARFVQFCSQGRRGVYFHLKAANGEIVLASEHYEAKAGAANGIASVRTHAADAANFVKLVAKNGQAYFTLRAKNNKVIGVSEMYSSTGARDNGIEAVQRAAANAVLVDATEDTDNCRNPTYPDGFDFPTADDNTEARKDGEDEPSSASALRIASLALLAAAVRL